MNIKLYNNGEEFILDNKWFLDKYSKYTSMLLMDLVVYKKLDKENFCIFITDNELSICAIQVKPFGVVVVGDKELSSELVNCLYVQGFIFDSILSEDLLGECIVDEIEKVFNEQYNKLLEMTYMECVNTSYIKKYDIVTPSLFDTDEVLELLYLFHEECHLHERPTRSSVIESINMFKVIKENNTIVSIAKLTDGKELEKRISCVYTRKEYRGKGYAKELVSYLTSHSLSLGFRATLNVDVNNKVTNHLYRSIGYYPIYNQTQFVKVKDNG